MALQRPRQSKPVPVENQVSELNLKSGTASKTTKRLVGVRLSYDFIAFGVNAASLSESMAGLHLAWDGYRVVVTHDAYPGQSKWVFPAGCKEVTWKDE